MTSKDKALKEHVLDELEARCGESVSGSRLASSLSVSRTAVWKAIQELRAAGYQINAITNRGYSLSPGSDRLSPQGISAHLRHRELAPGIHTFDTVESTNLTAKQMAVAGAAHGTVVAAATQTGGRGRLGRSFYSPRDTGIYFSVILRPEFMKSGNSPFNPVFMTTAAAVAVSRAIQEVSGKQVQIKWVNDLYLGEKKICGILTEGISNFETGTIESIVVGIGVNCFTPEKDFPQDICGRAAALYSSVAEADAEKAPWGRLFTKNALIASALDHLTDIHSELASGSFMDEYKRRSLVLGKEILFYPGGVPVSREPSRGLLGRQDSDAAVCQPEVEGGLPCGGRGLALDIDRWGGLVVQLPDGSRRTLSTGEISIRPAQSSYF